MTDACPTIIKSQYTKDHGEADAARSALYLLALTVPCPHCHVPATAGCVSRRRSMRGRPLIEAFSEPVHERRMGAAQMERR